MPWCPCVSGETPAGSLVVSLAQQQQAAQTPKKGPPERAEKLAKSKLWRRQRAQEAGSIPQFRQYLLTTDQLLASTMYREFTDNAKPDDAALKAYYEAHKEEWDEVKARHIDPVQGFPGAARG